MGSYVLKKDRKPMKPIMRFKQLKAENLKLKGAVEALRRFIRAMGFKGSYASWFSAGTYSHSALKACKKCGYPAYIEEDIHATGTYFVTCQHCMVRSKNYARISEAVRSWNRGELTELSEMLSTPLTKENMDTYGARNLVRAMGKQAARDYKASVKMGKPDKAIARFLDGIYVSGRPVVEALKEDALTDKEEEDDDEEF